MTTPGAVVMVVGIGVATVGFWPGTASDEVLHAPLEPRIVELSGQPVGSGEWLDMPLDLEAIGDQLLVVEAYGDPALKVLDRTSGALVSTVGPFGEGPGEFSGPSMAFPASGSDAVWVFDRELLRMTLVDTKPDTRHPERTRDLIQLTGDARPMAAAPLADGTWAGVGWFADRTRLGFFDAEGHLVRTAGRLEAGENIPTQALQYMYRAHLRAAPDGRRIALANRYSSDIELFGIDGKRLATVEPPVSVDPKFSVEVKGDRAVALRRADTQYAYIDVAATDDRVYALFSGRTIDEWGDAASLARHVHAFDWEGRLVEVIRLDRDVFGIAIDPGQRELYAIVHEPRPAILSYPLRDPVALAAESRPGG